MPQIYKLFSIPPNNSTTILHLLFTIVTYFQIADICSTLFLRAGASYRTYQQIDATKKKEGQPRNAFRQLTFSEVYSNEYYA